MNRLRFGMVCVALAVPYSWVSTARAQDAGNVKAEVYKMWDVDSMILQAADNVARRYNLNAQQTEYTRKMMVERVTKFLEENQEQIWPLVRDLARYQLSGSAPDESTAKRVGASALPIVEKAKAAIFEANREWGAILTEEQKRLHDYDLREMQGTFQKVSQNFEQWKSGQPVQNPIFPTYEHKDGEPETPSKPAERHISHTKKWAVQDGRWAKHVGDFIRKYNLDPAQREAAQSILREKKELARDYRDKHSKEFAELDTRLKEAFDSGDFKRRAAVEREETALNKPLDDMFKDLCERLDKIPTDAQKERFNQGVAAKKRPTTRPATSRPILPILPATQPEPEAKPDPATAKPAEPPAEKPVPTRDDG